MVLIEVTVTPKAARFDAIVFEYIVKHCPLAQTVVVACVRALNKVERPATLKTDELASASVIMPAASYAWRIAFRFWRTMHNWISCATSMHTKQAINCGSPLSLSREFSL